MTLCRVYGGEGKMMISPEGYYEIALRGKRQLMVTGTNVFNVLKSADYR